MNNGLATQIRGTFEALDDAQTPVTAEEVMQGGSPVGLLPIGEAQADARGRRFPLLVAAGAAVMAVAVVGAVAWLAPFGGGTRPVSDSPPPTDYIFWGLGIRAGDVPMADESMLESLMSIDGIALDVSGEAVGSAGASTVHSWRVRIDWIETALAGGSVAVSPDEFVRVYGEYAIGQVGEISVLASDALIPPDEHGGTELADPTRTVAQYKWTSTRDGDRWTFMVVDSLTGELVGSVTSPFPLMTDGLILTATTAATVEVVRSDWFEPGAEYETYYFDVDDSLLAYVKPGPGSNPVAFEVWRTTDGTNWDNLGPPRGFPSGHIIDISVSDGFYVVYLDAFDVGTGGTDPGPDFLILRSQNGIDWAP
jgi:hypothetical protein